MDIENYSGEIALDVCHPIDDDEEQNDEMNDLTNSMNESSISHQPLAIYIALMLEKLLDESLYSKEYDEESGEFKQAITLPLWFNGLDDKYKFLLKKFIEPALEMRYKNNS
tara:strand:- start:282 stop:614 length:333 start_codon:yes stop_codon:yes gene_type:complete